MNSLYRNILDYLAQTIIPNVFCFLAGATDGVYEFYAGGICSYSTLLNDPYVYKYGSVTGLTKGRVRLQGASVRTSILYGKSLGLDITLHDQIEIESVDGVAFGELGDSGSLVFQKDGNRLVAVGIFEGKGNDDTYMVTPILEMKQALSELMSRYRDPPSDTQMDVDEQSSAVTFMLYYVPPSSNVSLSAGIDRQISAEISRQTTEIQTNILHHTDHKIGSVKAELTAVKAHIDNTKQEIIENISSQISALSHAIMSDRLQMK
jgi:hypothetical protein